MPLPINNRTSQNIRFDSICSQSDTDHIESPPQFNRVSSELNSLLTTPVVFFVFNRPDTTEKVFNAIRQVRPTKLYVISDGPRPEREGELEKVKAAREIATNLDWECELITVYSDTNLGCKRRISSGIDIVFANERDAIFLEDDCIPERTFFFYCQELLSYYRENEQVVFINGMNHIGQTSEGIKESYYFTRYPHVHGWASWSYKWTGEYDVDLAELSDLQKRNELRKYFETRQETRFWRKKFTEVHCGQIDTWDYQVSYWLLSRKKLAIAPRVNLITNIGYFREDATHTRGGGKFANLLVHELNTPLTHPITISPNTAFDRIESLDYRIPNLLQRILSRIWLSAAAFFIGANGKTFFLCDL